MRPNQENEQDEPPLTLADFAEGMRVLYVPNHAHGDRSHPDCERGVVSMVTAHYVFVRYGGKQTPQATDPYDLRKL